MPNNELKKKCLEYDLHMAQAQLKHLGTDANFETMRKMAAFLKEHVTILTDTDVTDVDKAAHTVHYEGKGVQDSVTAEHIIFAVGRVGSRFFCQMVFSKRYSAEKQPGGYRCSRRASQHGMG